jgi:nitrile hydratase accessory protein
MSETGPDTNTETAREALAAVPDIPRDDEGPVFREPWEAQAFAMTLDLYQQDLFTWNEWATALSVEIKRAQEAGDPDRGDTYYLHWLAALERIVTDKGLTDDATLGRYQEAWRRAADRTPHGQPILLDPRDVVGDAAASPNQISPDSAPLPQGGFDDLHRMRLREIMGQPPAERRKNSNHRGSHQ